MSSVNSFSAKELRSTRCNSSFTLDKCFKNLNPKPAPEDAPEINPGMSAITKEEKSFFTTPRFGFKVVNG